MNAVARATQDIATLVGRSVRTSARDVESLLVAVILPIMLMATFVFVFGGALSADGEYVNYVVPGAILLCAGFGAAQTAVAVATDMSRGIVDRLRTMPIVSSAVLAGHVVASLARNAVATASVIVVAILLGFSPTAGAGDWLAAAAVLAFYILAISWFSALIGLLAGSPDAASGFTFVALFLPYVSSAFVPTQTLPDWLRGFAEHQPVTPVTETLRGFMLGTSTDQLGVAVAWCAGITVVSVVASAVAFRRRTR